MVSKANAIRHNNNLFLLIHLTITLIQLFFCFSFAFLDFLHRLLAIWNKATLGVELRFEQVHVVQQAATPSTELRDVCSELYAAFSELQCILRARLYPMSYAESAELRCILCATPHPLSYAAPCGLPSILWVTPCSLRYAVSSELRCTLWDTKHPLSYATFPELRCILWATRYPHVASLTN